jgi:hypothetical protein
MKYAGRRFFDREEKSKLFVKFKIPPVLLVKYASEYTGKPIKVGALPWTIIGPVFSLVGIFKPEYYDLKKMFDYIFTGQYVADTSLQQKNFGEVPTVKDSVFRYCQQIGLSKESN